MGGTALEKEIFSLATIGLDLLSGSHTGMERGSHASLVCRIMDTKLRAGVSCQALSV